MKWTPWLFGTMAAALIAGCGGQRGSNDTGAAGGAETETGTMQGGTGAPGDTGIGPATSDTAAGASDTAAGASDTAPGDTVRRNPDSTTAGSTQ